jgi:hypothetical protein
MRGCISHRSFHSLPLLYSRPRVLRLLRGSETSVDAPLRVILEAHSRTKYMSQFSCAVQYDTDPVYINNYCSVEVNSLGARTLPAWCTRRTARVACRPNPHQCLKSRLAHEPIIRPSLRLSYFFFHLPLPSSYRGTTFITLNNPHVILEAVTSRHISQPFIAILKTHTRTPHVSGRWLTPGGRRERAWLSSGVLDDRRLRDW